MCIRGMECQFANRRPRQVEFCTSSQLSHDVGMKLFSHNCVSCILPASASKLKMFSRIVFPVACVGGDTKSCTSSSFNLVKILLSTRRPSLFFFCQTEFMASIRYFSVNTDLFYRINCLEQEFCVHRISVQVNGCLTFLLLQDSTTQGTDTFEYKMTNFSESLRHFLGCNNPTALFEREKNCHTTSLPTLDPRMSNDLARISLRNS